MGANYISIYGRNPNTLDTTFDYPQPYLPMRLAPPLYFSRPAAASPIFGVTRVPVIDSDETRVQLDPSSTYSYTKRWKGLGDAGAEQARLEAIASNSRIAAAKKEAFEQNHPNIVKGQATILDVMAGNPMTTAIVVVIVGALGITAFKTIGKFF